MLTKNDCLLLLKDIKDSGVDTNQPTKKLLSSQDLPLEVLAFINKYKPLDLINFYNKLRKSYNNKRSNLYINIVKEIEDTNEVLTTLNSLSLQIALFSKNVSNKIMFLRHSRAREINLVLAKYYTDYDLTNCVKLIKLIKADLKACEEIEDAKKKI